MGGNGSGDRLDRVLERMKRSSAGPVPVPRGGFEDVERRRRRRRRDATLRAASLVLALAAAALLSWMLLHGASEPLAGGTAPIAVQPPSAPLPAPTAPPRPLPERTVVYVAEQGAVVRELADRVFAVDEGTVWFSVEPGSGRVEVRTPDRTVVVLGTVFAVRVEPASTGGGTTVGVLAGHVRVEPHGGQPVDLQAGEELAPRAAARAPLNPAWRERMTSLFPERVARQAPPAVPAPQQAPPVPPVVAEPAVPPAAPAPGRADHDAESPTLPIPPPSPPTWSQRYAAAEAQLRAGDAAAAAATIESLIDSAPSAAAAEVAFLDLARICRQNLRDFARAQRVYQHYLDRYPDGRLREDARLALCGVLAARGDGAGERTCLQAYLLEFPEGSSADNVRQRLDAP
jgi:hypothetical protein